MKVGALRTRGCCGGGTLPCVHVSHCLVLGFRSEMSYTIVLQRLLLLLLPHLHQRLQVLVVHLGVLEIIQRLHEDLPYAAVARALEESLGCVDKLLLIEVPRKRLARVVGQDADEHDGVVLP